MSESIIFNSPILLALYGIALVLVVYDLRNRSGAILPYLSAAIVMGTSAYALIIGASLFETAAVLCIFILINLYKIRGDKPAKSAKTEAKQEIKQVSTQDIKQETKQEAAKEDGQAAAAAEKVGEGNK